MPIAEEILIRSVEQDLVVDELGASFDRLGERYSGKVRENFSREGERLIVVSDRVSAFDVVLGTIPFKGQVLNELARFWFEKTAELMPNHMLSVPDPQAMKTVDCTPIPVEFVVRGYLTGVSSTSIGQAYLRGDRVFCGHPLEDGMQMHQRLPQTILTPSTKAPKGGHDESVRPEELFARGLISPEDYRAMEAQCLALFAEGQRIAAQRGLILVDTKYELGRRPDGEVVLIDEIHTPDSSRYWYVEGYEELMRAGEPPRSLDKEFLRRWLASQGFLGDGAPPPLSQEIRMEASRRYIETFESLTGNSFVPAELPPVPRLKRNLGL